MISVSFIFKIFTSVYFGGSNHRLHKWSNLFNRDTRDHNVATKFIYLSTSGDKVEHVKINLFFFFVFPKIYLNTFYAI